MDPLDAIAVVLVGVASGVLSGMFGVGGAVITTPGVRVLGATPIEAVGSTIPAILPSAASGTLRYARAGLVDWRVGLVCGAAGAALAVLGALVADVVDAHYLMLVTAALLGWSGVSLVRDATAPPAVAADEPPTTGAAAPGTGLLAAVGAAAGFVAGLLGVGGGIVMMPVFTKVLRLPIKVAVASSLVAVAIFSIPALVAHTLLGHINWTYALLLVAGVIPGAQLGARVTVGSSERTVRRLAGGFFVAMAVLYGGGELVSLVSGR